MGPQFWRSSLIISVFFSCVDSLRRKTNLMETPQGQFLLSGLAASFAWTLIWPFEVIKNMTHSEMKGVGASMTDKARYVLRKRGVRGFFRGVGLGAFNVFVCSGTAMMVLQQV